MLKGHAFENQVFNNGMFALFTNTMLDGTCGIDGSYGDSMNVTYIGNSVTVHKGACMICGRLLNEDSTTTLDVGSTAVYARLVIEIDLSKANTDVDFMQGFYKIITDISDYPSLIQQNLIQNETGIYQFPLAKFRVTSNGITDFVDEREYIDFDSIYGRISQHIQAIDDEKLFLPIGSGCDYYGTELPNENFMWADGSAISRTEYSELFEIIGTSCGEGDGSTTFNLPDKRSRTSVMLDSSITDYNAIGKKGGSRKHTLTEAEMYPHIHGNEHITGACWSRGGTATFVGFSGSMSGYGGHANMHAAPQESDSNWYGFQFDASHEHNSVGQGQPFSVEQPYMVCNYIIRVK